jgi:ParB/RepB/Spo0J family partition protein
MLPVDQLTIGLDFRLDDDPEDLEELALSIGELGVLQALVVRQVKDGWEVVAGRRRLAAARIAGLSSVPCMLRTLTADEAADVALAENMHRRDLSAVEIALAYARLRDRGLLQKEIAKRVGKSEGHVSLLLTLLEIPEELRDKVHRREMSYRTAVDRWRRRGDHGGGAGTHGKLTGDTAELVTHWRRRHDRLLAGIHQVVKAKTDTIAMRSMLNRLLQVDREPLAEQDGRQR